MPKLILIDHSLKGVGGHHFEYAVQVLEAADRAGYEPILAANRRFASGKVLPTHWRLLAPYRFATYTRAALVRDLFRRFPPAGRAEDAVATPPVRPGFAILRRWREGLRELERRRRGRHRRRDFERSTRTLFRKVQLSRGDRVFVPTLNDVDVAGLLRYLDSDPSSRLADWHLQFHDNVEPDWDADPARLADHRARLRRVFDSLRRRLATHRIHLYATTEALAQQYDRLGSLPFRALPFPLGTSERSAGVPPSRSLRIVFLGAGRSEKGLHALLPIVEELAAGRLAERRLQLVVQVKSPAKLPLAAQRLALRASATDANVAPAIRFVPHPLQTDAYRELVAGADVGLLLYDRWRYLDRFSGVFADLLGAGVPVIVSAGCWMAEQIAEEIFRHRERLRQRLRAISSLRCTDLERDGAAWGLTLDVPAGATHAIVAFRWDGEALRSRYVRLESQQRDVAARPTRERVEILGHRQDRSELPALIELAEGTRRLQLRWRSAYGTGAIMLDGVRADFLSAAHEPARSCPTGAVGLVAAEPSEVPLLLREMAEQHAHYRRTALEFGRRFRLQHSPERTVGVLLGQRAPLP